MSLSSKSVSSKSTQGHPLPANPYPQGGVNYTAYRRCQQLERRPAWHIFEADLPDDPPLSTVLATIPPIVAARVLGHALIHAPDDTGRAALVRDISACNEVFELGGLAHLYVFGFIRVFFNPKGPTPAVTPAFTPRLSSGSAAERSHFIKPFSGDPATLRALTLLRDNYRCVFTGKVDFGCLRDGQVDDENATADVTNVAHIISQPLTENIAGTTCIQHGKFQWASTAGAMVERFGGFSTHDVLGEDTLHSPRNAFTATLLPHSLLDSLDLWLTPALDAQRQVIPDTYDLCHVEGLHNILQQAGIKNQVVFRSVLLKDQTVPAPDPRIIELHAVCAKIAHMSGAADILRELYRDTESIAVMTQPNAVYELGRALTSLQHVSTTA